MNGNSEEHAARNSQGPDAVMKEEDAVETVNGSESVDTDDQKATSPTTGMSEPTVAAPHTKAKDRTLKEFLGMMDQYAPIVR